MTDASPTAAGLPEGTVTFLFTDIEGSTRRAEELGDEGWAELLETHHRLLREAFEAHGGVEVKTDGDAFFIAFDRATDAAAAAVDGQRAVEGYAWPEGEDLRVRMGLHTGEAIVREDDYVGHDVHRASRICDAGHGGQILLSDATAGLARDHLPGDASLTDLGLHRLKDLGGPQRLFGVEAPDLPSDFPPLRTLEAVPNNLPVRRSPFVGRRAEIGRVHELLERHPLVTLTGVGGAGKTRLALQVGAEGLEDYADGVFFVELASVSEPDLVARAFADALGIATGESGGGSPRTLSDLVVDVLSRRRCLLLVDNCEHLLDACADLVDRILGFCPEVVLLTTSREPLDVEGEGVYRVPSLSLPDEEADGGRSEAVELFVERARASTPEFELTDDNAGAVRAICRRLDGMPLAIEFAAARVAHLSPQQIAERLDDRFRLLTGGRRRVRRQQTLEAALDWSHDLLDDVEKILFRRLAVFSGSFPLGMVEEACADETVRRGSILDLLGSLVAKSLVATEPERDAVRYRLLETVRNYAEAKLRDAGEAQTFRTRHRDAYLGWVEENPLGALFSDADLLGAVADEEDNIRSALDWSYGEGRRDLVGRIAGRLAGRWWWGGRFDEGHSWLLWALEEPGDLSVEQQAMCYATLAACSILRLDGESHDHASRAVELGEVAPSESLVLGLSLLALTTGAGFSLTGDPGFAAEARRLIKENAKRARTLKPEWEVFALTFNGYAELLLDDVQAARRSTTAALDVDDGHRNLVHAMAASQLAVCQQFSGDIGVALETVQHALEDLRGTAERMSSSLVSQPPLQWVDLYLAGVLVHAAADDHATSAQHLQRAVRITDAHGFPPLVINECFIYAAGAAVHRRDPARACRLLAAGQTIDGVEGISYPFRTPIAYQVHHHYVGLVREALGSQEIDHLWAEGREMSREEAIAHALEAVGGTPEGTLDEHSRDTEAE